MKDTKENGGSKSIFDSLFNQALPVRWPGRPAVCAECRHYIKPSFYSKWFTVRPFKDLCGHPTSVDEIDGSQRPCITMRISRCDSGRLFAPREDPE